MTKARDAEAIMITHTEAVAKRTAVLGVEIARMDKLMGQATGNYQDVLSTATSGVGKFAGAVDAAIDSIYQKLGYKQNPKTGKWSDPYNSGENSAVGRLVTASKPTSLGIFGEMGTETALILRNPRKMDVAPQDGGGGGATSVVVNINGASVRNDQDISSLARAVAAEVERTLSRKGQMFGLRGPAV